MSLRSRSLFKIKWKQWNVHNVGTFLEEEISERNFFERTTWSPYDATRWHHWFFGIENGVRKAVWDLRGSSVASCRWSFPNKKYKMTKLIVQLSQQHKPVHHNFGHWQNKQESLLSTGTQNSSCHEREVDTKGTRCILHLRRKVNEWRKKSLQKTSSTTHKRLGCHADFYEVSRCHTRDESEDHTSEKARKGSTLALKRRADVTRSPKQGYQWPHQKDLCPTKTFFKKSYTTHEREGKTKEERLTFGVEHDNRTDVHIVPCYSVDDTA